MDQIKDRMIRTIGTRLDQSNTIYIMSNTLYIDELIKMLNICGLYNININDTITSIKKGGIIITFNIPPAEAIIYSIMADNNDGLLIYAECDGTKCHIICDIKTDIEKEGVIVNSLPIIHSSIMMMISGYIVTNVIKYIYRIGKLGNFKWQDNILYAQTKDIKLYGEPIFYKYINKFKGSIQSILPYITSKDIVINHYEKTYMICTIENNPTTIEHIVEWVRDKINIDEPRHDRFMILFNENIKELQSIFPNLRIMEPSGQLYEEFIKVNNINDYILTAVKIRAYNYNIDVPTNETIIDIYNKIEPTIPSIISFVNGLCEIEMMKFNNGPSHNFYTWDIDMLENKIIRKDIIPAKEIEINGVLYNEWHTFTYYNIDITLEDMIIDLNIMYGTFITMIIYNNSIIYNDNMNIDMDINIKTLFMDRFNIDIMKESIILQLVARDEILLPLKIENCKDD